MNLSIPNQRLFENIYNHYYDNEMLHHNQNKYISSHWECYSKQFKIKRDSNENVVMISGHGFGDMISDDIFRKILVYMCNFSYFVRLPFKLDILKLTIVALRICRKAGFYFSYDCFKQVCALNLIYKRNLREEERRRGRLAFLMIGDGYGFMSSLIKAVFPDSTLILVDIGKTLLFQSFYCQKAHPHKIHHSIFEEGDINMDNIYKYDFIYCPTEYLSKISNIKYDICINIASMQEMNQETISMYFAFLRNTMNHKNLFYCCNRELKVLVGGELLEFNKYPWVSDDRHLVDEYCPWYRWHISNIASQNGPKLFGLRVPFVNYCDGLFKHRLTVLSTSNR